jgi:hypothetical protein
MAIDRSRILAEITVLEDHIENITYDLDQQFIALENVPLPDPASPTTSIILELPNNYSTTPPRLYLPYDWAFNAEIIDNQRLLDQGPEGWVNYSFGWPHYRPWNPERDTTITILRLFGASLDGVTSDDTDEEDEL